MKVQRSGYVSVKLTDNQKQILEDRAKLKKVNLSTYLRLVLFGEGLESKSLTMEELEVRLGIQPNALFAVQEDLMFDAEAMERSAEYLAQRDPDGLKWYYQGSMIWRNSPKREGLSKKHLLEDYEKIVFSKPMV